jgi:hypothetical protein
MTLLEFRRSFAKALIYNEHMATDEDLFTPRKSSKRIRATLEHNNTTAPTHAKYFDGAQWNLDAKDPYQKYACKSPGCTARVRTYCSCSIGHWRCYDCYVTHRIEIDREEGRQQHD